MLRAVLDSSALVSSFLTESGPTARLLALAREGAFSLYLSPAILAETRRGLLRPRLIARYRHGTEAVERFCERLTAVATIVDDLPEISVVVRDPKDNHVVACALKAGASHVVTGDDHMLSLGSYQAVEFVKPRRFLELLAEPS